MQPHRQPSFDSSITDRDGVRVPNMLRSAVRAELQTWSRVRSVFPWHIIWPVLGRAGRVMVRRRIIDGREVHVVEPRTLNADQVMVAGPDGTPIPLNYSGPPAPPTRLERAARTYLRYRMRAWDEVVSAWLRLVARLRRG